MCLEKIDETLPAPEGVGWKVFSPTMGGDFTSHKPRPFKRWIHEKDYRISVQQGFLDLYQVGWHIFRTRAEARLWNCGGYKIRKVLYRGAHTQGFQTSGVWLRVIVAAEIFITETRG